MSITTRGNGNHQVKIFYHGDLIATKTFTRKKDAEIWQAEQQLALKTGKSPQAASTRCPTIETLAASWLSAKLDGKPSAQRERESHVNTWIVPQLGKLPANYVGRQQVTDFAKSVLSRRSASTTRNVMSSLRQIFAYAVDTGIIRENPATGVRLPASRGNEPHPLSQKELTALIHAMPTRRDRLFVTTLAYSGIRIGEAPALTRDSIPTPTALWINRAIMTVNGRITMSTPKNHQARRIGIPEWLGIQLIEHATRQQPGKPLFTSSNGRILRPDNWRARVFRPALERAGLPSFTPHNLRDTCATMMLTAGASIPEVAAQLGHKDPAVTMRHYAGYTPGRLADITQRLPQPH